MKRILLLVLLSISFSPTATAQRLHGRILIVRGAAATKLTSEVLKVYSGQVDGADSVPLELSNYDAILMERLSPDADSSAESRLIGYVRQGGKFYLEGPESGLRVDSLLSSLGVTRGIGEDIFIRFR